MQEPHLRSLFGAISRNQWGSIGALRKIGDTPPLGKSYMSVLRQNTTLSSQQRNVGTKLFSLMPEARF